MQKFKCPKCGAEIHAGESVCPSCGVHFKHPAGDQSALHHDGEDIHHEEHAPQQIKTLTVDNGKEFARHGEIEQATGGKVYFAHPHSPWERASNENANGRLRRWFPKGIDIRKISEADLSQRSIR